MDAPSPARTTPPTAALRQGRPSRARAARLALLPVLAALAVAGCAAGAQSGSTSAGDGPRAVGVVESSAAAGGGTGAPIAVDGPTAPAPKASAAPGADAARQVTRRASLVARVASLDPAVIAARGIARDLRGHVIAEKVTVPGPVEPTPATVDRARPGADATSAEMTIAVPSASLDTALSRLQRLGTVVSREVTSDDVTQEFVDTQGRVSALRASLSRVRALMQRAGTLTEVIKLEEAVSAREADLEAMERRLAALKDAVALAPITITWTTAAASPLEEPAGFAGGVGRGWAALTAFVAATVTVVGLGLPWLGGVTLVALPALWWARRRRSARRAAASGS